MNASKASGVTFLVNSPLYRELQACYEDRSEAIRLCYDPDHAKLKAWCMQHQTTLCVYCNPYYASGQHILILDWLSDDKRTIMKRLMKKGDYPKGAWDVLDQKEKEKHERFLRQYRQ